MTKPVGLSKMKFLETRQYWGIIIPLILLTLLNIGAWVWMFFSVEDIKKCENKASTTCPFFTCPVPDPDVVSVLKQGTYSNEAYLPLVQTENGPERLDPDIGD